jgi:hypothetical protein
VEVRHDLMYDHDRLPHFAHVKRNDRKRGPPEVLNRAKGREVDTRIYSGHPRRAGLMESGPPVLGWPALSHMSAGLLTALPPFFSTWV